jgi:hypothetical protein
VSNQQTEFADFFQASWEPCLRALVAVVGSPALAEDQVAEAFAKASASWPKLYRDLWRIAPRKLRVREQILMVLVPVSCAVEAARYGPGWMAAMFVGNEA